jgi:hypothetical protein
LLLTLTIRYTINPTIKPIAKGSIAIFASKINPISNGSFRTNENLRRDKLNIFPIQYNRAIVPTDDNNGNHIILTKDLLLIHVIGVASGKCGFTTLRKLPY